MHTVSKILFRGARGFTLIETLVAATITTIVMVAIASIMSAQYREGRALTEKLAALDIEKLMITALADGRICGFQFTSKTGVATNTFNANGVSAQSPAKIPMTYIPAAPVAGASALVQLQNTLPPKAQSSPLTPTLQIKEIALANIQPAGPDSWLADYTVVFDDTKLVRTIHALSVRTTITTTGPVGAKVITACVGSGLASTATPGASGANPGATPTTGLCKPGPPLYRGIVPQCNERYVGPENIINGCPAVYMGNVCITQ